MTRMIPTKEAILLRSDQHSVFVMEISLKDSENQNDKQQRQQDADKKRHCHPLSSTNVSGLSFHWKVMGLFA
jgi:hypothetical protein